MFNSEIFALNGQLSELMMAINKQIDQVKRDADLMRCEPEEVKTSNGEYLMTPLLLAKANVIASKVALSKE